MNYKYLIIGGGMAADKAVRGIRAHDTHASVAIISSEKWPCYDRPPLSKALWTGAPEESIWCKTEDLDVTFHLGESVLEIDPKAHEVKTKDSVYGYEKLLVATGVVPKKLNCPDEGVCYLHDLDDYHHLRELYDEGEHFLVIGSGYIGTEVAAALAQNGKRVTMAFPGPAIYHRKLPRDFANFLNAYFTEQGVQLKPNVQIHSVVKNGELYDVELSSGEKLSVDGVVAGIGCEPNLEFAHCLKQANGIEVDEFLQSSDPDIYAAGDCANVYYPLVKTRLRMEHEDVANSQGFVAGENMAGARKSYGYQPYFYSEMFDLGYEAVGLMGASFEMVPQWEEEYRKGTIYYCSEGKVVGAMLWGIWDETDRIREMVHAGVTVPAQTT
ncbi:MAG: FAD-dependent oxidoreductase [Chlamydiae bacterium]|nr:Dicamba O-demethylase 2, ferredoxin reductase component [Chlamydiales bacterium]MCH9704218.1 FAD-dependent oxidoreductase [Chlamydiota bacterium]